jgi:hypothetical protein
MNIVILGGGTAGWLAAFMISKTQPDHSVTVIESSTLGIIGAGEGSTGSLTNIVRNQDWDFGLDEEEFLKKTGATVKLGILHKDWKTLGHEYIAPIDGPASVYSNTFGTSASLCHLLANDKPFHMGSFNGYNIEHNSSSFYFNNGKLDNAGNHAYHFDGHLVGAFFKEKSPSVKHLDAIVSKANVNELGEIVSLTLDGGLEVFGDFFIDASGFARLLSKTLGIKWISYKDYLPVDTAIPFLVPFKNNEKISPVTTAWAQKNGWMWRIPTQERYGCGYVFSSQYTDVDSAKKEVEMSLGHEISPIKVINFEAGRLETMWSKNCLFIGLSSAFLEPLEATSIHSTITQLFSFIFSYLRDTKEETCNQGAINTYNTISANMYDGFRDFLSIHYASNRSDSEFWRDISKEGRRTERAKNILDIATYRVLNDGDFFKSTGFEGSVLHNWVLAGLGKITKETARKELEFYRQTEYGQEFHAKFLQDMNSFRGSAIENTHLINILRS